MTRGKILPFFYANKGVLQGYLYAFLRMALKVILTTKRNKTDS